ncbi:MAG: hypothetical protein EAY70_02235 [Sphingomonadales bacterium]|nr:MAG: hypothetical protein EAY70_02235 [Sphingomonadales bacterium]
MLTDTTSPLPPLPWLDPSEPALSCINPASRKTGQSRTPIELRGAIGAVFVGLCVGPSFLLLWPLAQPVPGVDLVRPAQTAVTAVASAPVETSVADSAALIAAPAPVMPEAAPPAVIAKAPSRTAIAAPSIGRFPAVEARTTNAAPIVTPPAPPAADTPASAEIIAEFRLVVEESRNTARRVIRLASRQRPPRDVSAEELARYRIWQQNADAARDYRQYLDTLSRSMRGSPSQAVSQRLLERARQTQTYLTKMLADSQAAKN